MIPTRIYQTMKYFCQTKPKVAFDGPAKLEKSLQVRHIVNWRQLISEAPGLVQSNVSRNLAKVNSVDLSMLTNLITNIPSTFMSIIERSSPNWNNRTRIVSNICITNCNLSKHRQLMTNIWLVNNNMKSTPDDPYHESRASWTICLPIIIHLSSFERDCLHFLSLIPLNSNMTRSQKLITLQYLIEKSRLFLDFVPFQLSDCVIGNWHTLNFLRGHSIKSMSFFHKLFMANGCNIWL